MPIGVVDFALTDQNVSLIHLNLLCAKGKPSAAWFGLKGRYLSSICIEQMQQIP